MVVRAGEDGKFFDEFVKHDVIAIGWDKIMNMRSIKTRPDMDGIYRKAYPRESNVFQSINVGQLWSFLVLLFTIIYNNVYYCI